VMLLVLERCGVGWAEEKMQWDIKKVMCKDGRKVLRRKGKERKAQDGNTIRSGGEKKS